MPAAEVDVTVELVEALIAEQHPDLADLAVVELANGWDNVMFRLGDRPCRAHAASRDGGAPDRSRAGRPPRLRRATSDRDPRSGSGRAAVRRRSATPGPWSIVPTGFRARSPRPTPFADPATEAHRLGAFLRALHPIGTSGCAAEPVSRSLRRREHAGPDRARRGAARHVRRSTPMPY